LEKDVMTIVSYHREDGDMEFLNTLSKSLGSSNSAALDSIVFIITAGATSEGGPIILTGKKGTLAVWNDLVQSTVGCGIKGGGKGERFQGKAVSWKFRKELMKQIGAVDQELALT
jgi:hypothetical protein